MGRMPVDGATVEALESVYRAGLSRFVRAAAAIVGEEGGGKDAVQEAFAEAVRRRARFRYEAPLEAWVWRIVINQALAQRRRRARELERGVGVPTAVPVPDGPEEDSAVRAWVAALPERQRLAVFLRYFADLDYRSIATALEIEVGTVSATLGAAHATLRRSFEEVAR
jgi:RNA polymerase sigma-70 factor (ECF subfamily)